MIHDNHVKSRGIHSSDVVMKGNDVVSCFT